MFNLERREGCIQSSNKQMKKNKKLETFFRDKKFFKTFLRKKRKVTLVTSYPGFDMVIEGHVSGEDKFYPVVYLFEKKDVFDYLVKINCKFERITNNVFWITAR